VQGRGGERVRGAEERSAGGNTIHGAGWVWRVLGWGSRGAQHINIGFVLHY